METLSKQRSLLSTCCFMSRHIVSGIFMLLLLSSSLRAQVVILSSSLNSYNITPQSMCAVTMMNYGNPTQVYLQARLTNSAGVPLLVVRSAAFTLKKGMNAPGSLSIGIQSAQFGTLSQGEYIKSSHILPSGKFRFCCSVVPVTNTEGDDFCDDLESDISSFLNLVSPDDKDTIDTRNPLLIWNHSEPFNLLASGEYFRLILVELKTGQTAESGIATNTPRYMKINLCSHQVQYPFDAYELENGKRYGWQVQKISSGVIEDKSEAWEFIIEPENAVHESKYASLKKILDAGYYMTESNKVFFKFEESYGSGKIQCRIYDSKRHMVLPKTKSDAARNVSVDFKQNGYNRFVIDLNELDIKTGFHTLEVKNEKNEIFLLKFYAN
ncbi:MAG TPA: hypothetical protein VFC34_09160, partial [Puia sp.]|nr:hypothetical protein [Puia sp.]